MTNVLFAAALALAPADLIQLTNRVEILWTAHTSRVARAEAHAEALRQKKSGPPDRPFRIRQNGRR